MITVKNSTVHLKVLTPALAWIFYKLSLFHEERLSPQPNELVITSINDSVHTPGSKHYSNEAIDLRSHSFLTDEHKIMFAMRFQDYLGPKFRVLLEHIGEDNEHFHIQVKKGMSF